MIPILIAGGVAAAAFFLTGCGGKQKEPPGTVPPKVDPPKPKYQQDFDPQSEIYEFYHKAKELGVTDPELDMGCPTRFYSDAGDPIRKIIGSGDKKIQDCEVYEYILNRWDQERFAPLAQSITGKPIPWSLDDLDSATTMDQEVRDKVDRAIAFLDKLLEKQGLEAGSKAYREHRLWGLFYLVAFPGMDSLNKLNVKIASLEKEPNPNILHKQSLGRLKEFRRALETLNNRMLVAGLQEFRDYHRLEGGFRTRSNFDKEYTALGAIEKQTGDCTEMSKILYGVLKRAGYEPHFVHVDPWKSQYPGIKYLILENPNYTHIAIGLNLGGTDYLLDPTLADPEASHRGGKEALSLRQYLSMDYDNRGVDFLRMEPPQVESAGEEYWKGHQLDPRNVSIHVNLGTWWSQKVQMVSDEHEKIVFIEKAIETFDNAISINPGYAISYAARSQEKRNLGEIEAIRAQARGGDIMKAEKLFKEALADLNYAIKLNPKNWSYYFVRANFHFTRGNLNEVGNDLARSINLAPRNATEVIMPYLLTIYEGEFKTPGKYKNLDIVRQELSVGPASFMATWELTVLLFKAGHYQLARNMMEGPVRVMEEAKERLEKQGKSFSPATTAFFHEPLKTIHQFSQELQDLKARIDKLGIPIPAAPVKN